MPASAVQDDDDTIASAFDRAVAQVVLDQPMLQVGIVGEGIKQAYFVALPSLDLAEHVEWVDLPADASPGDADAAILRALERRHDTPWPGLHRRPGWKLTVFRRRPRGGGGVDARSGDEDEDHVTLDVSLAVHHAHADGKSTALFHAALLRALDAGAAPVPPALGRDRVLSLPTGRRPALQPPQEALVPFRTSLAYLAATLWAELVPAWLRPAPRPLTPWTGGPIAAPAVTRLRLAASLPAAEASRVLAACRRRGTTLTPLVHALVAASAAARLPAEVVAGGGFSAVTPRSAKARSGSTKPRSRGMVC